PIGSMKTRELARTVLFEDLKNIKTPQWQLVDTVEDAKRLAAKFGTADAYGEKVGQIILAVQLRAGKYDDAAKRSEEIKDSNLFRQIGAMLAKHQESEQWA